MAARSSMVLEDFLAGGFLSSLSSITLSRRELEVMWPGKANDLLDTSTRSLCSVAQGYR